MRELGFFARLGRKLDRRIARKKREREERRKAGQQRREAEVRG